MSTRDVLRGILTGRDNVTHDLGHWFGALSGVAGIGLSAYDCIVNKAHFDAQAFGIGMAALAGGIGAFLRLDSDAPLRAAPPPPPPPSDTNVSVNVGQQ